MALHVQPRIEHSVAYPQAELQKLTEQLEQKRQQDAESALLQEREVFVRHIEAFCDCV